MFWCGFLVRLNSMRCVLRKVKRGNVRGFGDCDDVSKRQLRGEIRHFRTRIHLHTQHNKHAINHPILSICHSQSERQQGFLEQIVQESVRASPRGGEHAVDGLARRRRRRRRIQSGSVRSASAGGAKGQRGFLVSNRSL